MTLAQLLVVQAHDSAIDRLRHQRANLPEFGALESCADERTYLDSERAVVAESRHELERTQKRLEDEVALIEDRHTSERARLYSGTVTAHKDLQAIQDELDTLARRQGSLEDQVLEVMEQAEPIDAKIGDFDDKIADLERRVEEIRSAIEQRQAEIDAEIAEEDSNRAVAAADVDADLMATYETTRADCGGIGVARLVHKTCEGCHLQLSAVDYDRIRKEPSHAVVHCECGRILVRDA